MVKKKSAPKVKEQLDITDELIAERRTSLKMPRDMKPWMAKTIEFIDAKMLITGKIVSWAQETILPVINIFASINSIVFAIQGFISLGILRLVLLSAISSSVMSNCSFTLGADFFLTIVKSKNWKF